MLKLFQSIFGGESQGRYPESLIEMAIERAVDGTDRRLRALSGYRKSLRAPVIHAIDHVVALVDSLPAPLAVGGGDFNSDPRINTLFASPEHVREVFVNDMLLSEFRQHHPSDEKITVLLLAERVEKRILGMELNGDMLRREIEQIGVNFRGQRFVDPDVSEAETRRQLKRRAFDHLLSLALLRITEVQGERANLNRQRDLLKRKLNTLQHSGWNFEETGNDHSEPALLQTELDDIEGKLDALGMDDQTLNAHLDIVVGVLAEAERQFWVENIELHLDRMNIQRDAQDESARHFSFQELHNARGRSLVMLLIEIDSAKLPKREDMFTAAMRYLG